MKAAASAAPRHARHPNRVPSQPVSSSVLCKTVPCCGRSALLLLRSAVSAGTVGLFPDPLSSPISI